MKRFIFILSFLLLTNWNAQAATLYILSNHENAGDHNQALGIAASYQTLTQYKTKVIDLNAKVDTPLSIKEKIEADLVNGKVIVVGTGEGGIKEIKKLTPNPDLMICLASHMFLKDLADPTVLGKVNFIALPSHIPTADKLQLGSKLIETTGVAHNRHAEVADTLYKKWGKMLPLTCKKYIGVALGGDAPTPSHKINFFTEDDATKLAQYITKHAKNACVVIVNGPRTGKHDKNGTEILTAHKDGKLDSITSKFKNLLEAKLDAKNVKVFDFQFNKKTPYNAFDLMAGAVRATKGTMIVPGESTSTISEAIDLIPHGHVVVYNNSAMNESHKTHVQSELAAGRISILENYQDIKSPPPTIGKPKPSAATVIAQKLIQAAS